MNAIDQVMLNEIARMAYCSRNGSDGGRGKIGIFTDETGRSRLVKYDTHFFRWSTANSNDPAQLAAANALRQKLLEIAENKGVGEFELAQIRKKLGLAPQGTDKAGTSLLKRTIVAEVVRMIDRDIWTKAFVGLDRGTYSTRNVETAFGAVIGETNGDHAANRAFGNIKSVGAGRTIVRAALGSAQNAIGRALTGPETEALGKIFAHVLSLRVRSDPPATEADLRATLRAAVPFALAAIGRDEAARLACEACLDELPRGFKLFACINQGLREAGEPADRLIPDDVREFLDTLHENPTYATDEQGEADRLRVFRQVADLCLVHMGLPDDEERQSVGADIRFILERVRKGFADPLPFGLGKRTSGFSPAQKDFIRRGVRVAPDVFTMGLEEYKDKWGKQALRDLKGGMSLTINGVVISAPGREFRGKLADLLKHYEDAFTSEEGVFDEKGFRLSLQIAHQGGLYNSVVREFQRGLKPWELFYSPTGIVQNSEQAGMKNQWGFTITSTPGQKVSIRITHVKKNPPAAQLQYLDQGGSLDTETLRSFQRPLAPGRNYQKVDVEFAYRYETDEVGVELSESKATYEFQRVATDDEVAEGNGESLNRVMDEFDTLANEVESTFRSYSSTKVYNLDKGGFKTWLTANRSRLLENLNKLDHGDKDVIKRYERTLNLSFLNQIRYIGHKEDKFLQDLIAQEYAQSVGYSELGVLDPV